MKSRGEKRARQMLQVSLSKKFCKPIHGPTPTLTWEENVLVRSIFEHHKKGLPRKNEHVQLSVKQFLIKSQYEIHLKTIFPEKAGIELFCKGTKM